jgi:predicted phosphodiesterase
MTKITWLHLSDLHFQEGDEHNRQIVLEALWEDIKTRISEGLEPDFIVFTGDIAFHGCAKEYALAEEHFFRPLLETTNLSPNQLFVVPGNHDVDRNKVASLATVLPTRLIDRDSVNDFWASKEERKKVLKGTKAYSDFVRHLFAGCWRPQEPAVAYVRSFSKGGIDIAVIGLNSAWMSSLNKEAGEVCDYGHLLLSERQLSDAIEKAKNARIRIALMHHPFDSLREFDRIDAESWLRGACHFVLRGHRHLAGFSQEATLEGEVIIIPAGAAYERRGYPNGYNWVCLDMEKGEGSCYLRRYNDQRREWQSDRSATGEKLEGKAGPFRLPGDLSSEKLNYGTTKRFNDEKENRDVPSKELAHAGLSIKVVDSLEDRVQKLSETFWGCARIASEANRIGTLHDGERLDLVQAFDFCYRPYIEFDTYVQRIMTVEKRFVPDVWDINFSELKRLWTKLNRAICNDQRQEIIKFAMKVGQVLDILRISIRNELAQLIEEKSKNV